VGILSAFKRDPDSLVIELAEEALRPGERLEHALCHEATHGLLTYGSGLYYAKAREGAPQGTAGQASLLMTMLDDLVVNQRLAEAKLRAYLPSYIANVKRATEAIQRGTEKAPASLGSAYHAKFRVFRYVTAWGCVHLWGAPVADRRILARFLRQLSQSYPSESEEARRIIGHLEANDLQTRGGHLAALRALCDLWDLSAEVELVSERPAGGN